MNTKAFILEQIMQVLHRYPQNTEEIPKKKYLLPIHLTFIENFFTTTIVLMAIQLCFPSPGQRINLLLFLWQYNCAFPLSDQMINVLHTRRFGSWLSHYIKLLLTRKLVFEICVLTDRLLCNKGSEVWLSPSIP